MTTLQSHTILVCQMNMMMSFSFCCCIQYSFPMELVVSIESINLILALRNRAVISFLFKTLNFRNIIPFYLSSLICYNAKLYLYNPKLRHLNQALHLSLLI